MAQLVRVVVAVENAAGAPDFFPTIIECTSEQYDDGKHYDAAVAAAEDKGYKPKLCYDQRDPGFHLLAPLFDADEGIPSVRLAPLEG